MLPAFVATRGRPVTAFGPRVPIIRALLVLIGGRRLLVIEGVAEIDEEDALWVSLLGSWPAAGPPSGANNPRVVARDRTVKGVANCCDRSVEVADLVPDTGVIGTDLPEAADMVFAALPVPIAAGLAPGWDGAGTPDKTFDPTVLRARPDLAISPDPAGRGVLNPAGCLRPDRVAPGVSFMVLPLILAILVLEALCDS
jgi:hypothetical protein